MEHLQDGPHHHRNQYAAVIDDVYYAVLDDPTKGLNAINLCTLVMHILNIYAQISQPDLDDNMTDFHSGINSGLPLAVYTRKQENGRSLPPMPVFQSPTKQ
jgi:hypothetical protein